MYGMEMTQRFVSINQKFGKLKLRDDVKVTPGSHARVWWSCDCGKDVQQSVRYVTRGRSTDCRRCNAYSQSLMAATKFGKLKLIDPVECLPASEKRLSWQCDCGKTATIAVFNVLNGRTKSCGSCNTISKEELSSARFGKLTMVRPEALKPNSNRKIRFLCDCGNETVTMFKLVTSGETRSCGMCNAIPASILATKKFGRLRLKEPKDVRPNSDQKLIWICDCGNETEPYFHNVIRGLTKSCGKCVETVRDWLDANREGIDSMSFPIDPKDFPAGGVKPLEPILGRTIRFRALCAVCDTEYSPRLDKLLDRPSLTCGCSTNRVSNGVKEIGRFISGLGLEVRHEEKASGLKFDVFVPSHGLLIEYQGLRWHSMPGSRARDLKKAASAAAAGLQLIVIFEDEWTKSRHKVEALLRNRLTTSKPRSLRPSQCRIGTVSAAEANTLYESHHYIGKCVAKEHYGVVFEERVIAAASFSIPTRQSRHPWELLRMASDPAFRVHGAWSKIMNAFVMDHRPSSIVSFSDNRLFGGRVYEKLGFRNDGAVAPDYFWVRGDQRFHKSGLRKKGSERESGLTERELREAEGYKRVWDLGKMRWVWTP